MDGKERISMAQKTYGIDFGTGTIKIYKKGNGIGLRMM